MTSPRRPRSYDEEEVKKRKAKPRTDSRALNFLRERNTEAPRASLHRSGELYGPETQRRQERYARGEYPVSGAEEPMVEKIVRKILGIP